MMEDRACCCGLKVRKETLDEIFWNGWLQRKSE